MRLEWADLRPERDNLRPKSDDLRPKSDDFRLKRTDDSSSMMRPERLDLWPDRTD